MPEPTPRQIALVVAALKANISPMWWAPDTYLPVQNDSKRVIGNPGTCFPTPITALAAAAEALGLEPDPQVWGNHLRLQVIEVAWAVEEHRLDCPNDCGLRHDKCATAAELGEQFRAADEALYEFREREAEADG